VRESLINQPSVVWCSLGEGSLEYRAIDYNPWRKGRGMLRLSASRYGGSDAMCSDVLRVEDCWGTPSNLIMFSLPSLRK